MRIGKITENVLKRSVWKQIHNGKYKNGAAGYTDCACFEIDKRGVLSAIHTVTAGATHSGKYAVVGACNNILADGGKPVQVLLSITLPKDEQEGVLRTIMQDAEYAANAYGAEIAGGHTEVSASASRPLVTATAVGYGKTIIKEKIKGGDIVVTKWIALSGSAMLAEDKGGDIKKKYPPFIIDAGLSFGKMDYLSVASEAQIADSNEALLTHDISSGGIFAALWELGQMTGLGMDIDLKKIPIRQETVEITDVFDVNPYLLASAGALLIVAQDGNKMVSALEKEGIPGVVIGRLTQGNERIIRNEDETRYLDLPQSDEILRILSD